MNSVTRIGLFAISLALLFAGSYFAGAALDPDVRAREDTTHQKDGVERDH